jgi:DNA-binding NtrC family response regulator
MPTNPNRPRAAIVGDDMAQRSGIAASLRADFEVEEAENYQGAYQVLRESRPDILILDLNMASGGLREGLALLRELGESDLDTLAIVVSDDKRKATALKVMDAGAYDYFLKPAAPDILRVIALRAVEKLNIERENRILRDELYRKDSLGDLLGSSDAMRSLVDSIRRVARTATTVVIRGESGSGKELVARAIHDLSQRRDRPFVSVNCAALPETLMESELFGYEKGAFTGAVAAKEGRIELAHQGTLFLDEIGILSPALQSKLLRVLDEHVLVRLGGKKPIKVDFRLLTATNEDLEKAVREGRFREDLYYRIHVMPLFVPPLRERTDDIPLLTDYFVSVYCAKNRFTPKRVSEEVLQVLKHYAWPGNVRELENVVQRMVVMTDDEVIGLKSLPPDLAPAVMDSRSPKRFRVPPEGINLEEETAAYERRWLEAALAQANRDTAQAARLLGVDRKRIYYLRRKHNLG